ncbi:hypothetical protein SCHPADRAFT_127484 [Schizopora paradoxa]|uniref:Uncharacterized protein n=1 Tax=Schizopora paradoxa TaxID=27342 RepID=A0A0H2S1P7_9AGAM|nr:hypothetical protein SCHPADRAFT_127484 [Schizopora paradoxa]
MRSPVTAILLFLAFAWAVIGGSVGINALVKSRNTKNFVKDHSPQGVDVNINTNDIFRSGVVLTVACGVLAITALVALNVFFFQRPRAGKLDFSRVLAPLMLFFTLWVFATLIPVTDFAVNRSAIVTATAGGVPVPQSLVDQVQAALGVSPKYWDQHYIHLMAILPWITVLFGFLASIALFAHARRPTAAANTTGANGSREEKEYVEQSSVA